MTAQRGFFAIVLMTASAMAFHSQSLLAIDCSLATSSFGASLGTVFNVTPAGFSNSDIQTAAGYWACPGYTGFIPSFGIEVAGGVPVTVVRRTGNSTAAAGGCGRFSPEIVNGRLESAVIEVWTAQANGESCTPLTDSIAHEFGHLLGLDDAPDPRGQCLGHIMGSRVSSFTRTVQADDCQVADQKWETTNETELPDPFCDAYCLSHCVNNVCQDHPSPILMDLENDGIHLTGLDDPVWFDIDADGTPDLMSWTDRGEGLLALDRNGNGWIDDGGELFGNATRLSNGTRALNGYLALAELDSWAFGGNEDSHLDSTDATFGTLLLWIDRNHDGTSQPDELQTLTQAGVRRIGLEYRSSRRTDRHGNEFRFMGTAVKTSPNGVARLILTWDVFFVAVP